MYGAAWATTGTTYGVYGESDSSSGYGVYGTAPVTGTAGIASYTGVYGTADDLYGRGVFGWASDTSGGGNPIGVWGQADDTSGTGVFGWATNSSGTTWGVYGRNDSSSGRGVYGYATANTGTTYGVYGKSDSNSGRGVYGYATASGGKGVYGEAPGTGVYGKATATTGTTFAVSGEAVSSEGRGVFGYASKTSGENYGVYGSSNSSDGYGVYAINQFGGVGLYARSLSGNPIEAYGSGYDDREFYVDNDGDVYADGTYSSPATDFAEMLPAVDGLEPGDVLVIGPNGKLTRSTEPYQASVVGVYSTKPGFLGGAGDDADLAGKVPLALVGLVPVKASAENGPIRPGDLLVASSTPGYAMRADPNPPIGTVIGKALEGLDSGTDLIQMLVTLQ